MILASLSRFSPLRPLAAVLIVLLAAAPPALAQQQPSRAARPQTQPSKPQAQPKQVRPAKPAGTAGPGGATARLLDTFGDWEVYTAQPGGSKICYALTQPKDRLPKGLNRDPAYLFVSFRPTENVSNEVALVMGFPTKEDAPAEATIGKTSYALLPKAENAWLRNRADEGPAIESMVKGESLLVKVQSQRGNDLTDRYSLLGFTKALERAKKECS